LASTQAVIRGQFAYSSPCIPAARYSLKFERAIEIRSARPINSGKVDIRHNAVPDPQPGWLEAEYAVSMPAILLWVQRGSMPGFLNACLPLASSIYVPHSSERYDAGFVQAGKPGEREPHLRQCMTILCCSIPHLKRPELSGRSPAMGKALLIWCASNVKKRIIRLQGKVAVVTGAGTGIGHAIAVAFAQAGAAVVVDPCIHCTAVCLPFLRAFDFLYFESIPESAKADRSSVSHDLIGRKPFDPLSRPTPVC
jgi:hypothetical protein